MNQITLQLICLQLEERWVLTFPSRPCTLNKTSDLGLPFLSVLRTLKEKLLLRRRQYATHNAYISTTKSTKQNSFSSHSTIQRGGKTSRVPSQQQMIEAKTQRRTSKTGSIGLEKIYGRELIINM